MTLSVGGLFSGIGGLELGLERAGFDIAWHCEADEFCRRILELRWPGVPCYPDVCTLAGRLVEPVDMLCGGFPCQDISNAGFRAGIAGARSGLWAHFARLVGELRPRYVLVENVAAILGRGIDRVLGDLAELGYDAEWSVVPACAFGAPHMRRRVFLVAYPASDGRDGRRASEPSATPMEPARRYPRDRRAWPAESRPVGVADGIPARVDRLRSLGNAVVPQIPEWIGRRILEHEAGLA